MIQLNLLDYRDRLQHNQKNGEIYLWDPLRHRWLISQPEELVRQLWIIYLTNELRFSPKLIQVEKKLIINGLNRRYDMLVYDHQMKPFMLVECKAPQVSLNQPVFEQIAQYNLDLNVPYLLVSNGIVHYCCHMKYLDDSYEFLEKIPGPSN